MKATLAAAGRDVIIDRETGSPSLINLMDEIQTTGFPVPVSLSLLYVIAKEDGDAEVTECSLQIKADSEILFTQTVIVDFKNTGKNNLILKFVNLPVSRPTKMSFQLINGNKLVGMAELGIKLIDQNLMGQMNIVQMNS